MGDSHKPLLRFNEFARVLHRTQRNICLRLPKESDTTEWLNWTELNQFIVKDVMKDKRTQGHTGHLAVQQSGLWAVTAKGPGSVPSQGSNVLFQNETKDIDVTDVQPDGRKKCLGQGMGKVVWHSHALAEHATLPAPPCFHQLRSSLISVLLCFYGAFIT